MTTPDRPSPQAAPDSAAPDAAAPDPGVAPEPAAPDPGVAPEPAAPYAGTTPAPGADGASAPPPSPPDPIKGFRGVMAGALVMEAITVGLALFAVADLYGGLNSTVGYLVGFVILALLLTCGFLRHNWTMIVVLVLQLVLVGCIVSAAAVGIVGLLFLVVWVFLFWLRREVARRMAAGQLPGQRSSRQS
jgi:hypothetical protein